MYGPRAPCLSIWNRVEIIYDERERAIDGLEIVPHKAVCHFAVDHACTWNATETDTNDNLCALVCACLLEMWIVIAIVPCEASGSCVNHRLGQYE